MTFTVQQKDYTTGEVVQEVRFWGRDDAMGGALFMVQEACNLPRRSNPDIEFTYGQIYAARALWTPEVHGNSYHITDPYSLIDIVISCDPED